MPNIGEIRALANHKGCRFDRTSAPAKWRLQTVKGGLSSAPLSYRDAFVALMDMSGRDRPRDAIFNAQTRRLDMKIVVIGGTGLIGSKTVERLRRKGHEVVAASPNSGVNTITGEGLPAAVKGASVVLDLANSPSFEDQAAMEFFQTSGRNLLAAENAADVKHHIALSVVGTERLQGSGYLRAKMAQEDLIRSSGIPYTIVHATQFYEFMAAIAKAATVGQTVRLSPAYVQPMAADDVADAMADVALAAPLNGTIEIAGPDRVRLSDLVADFLKATDDPREVIADPHALYYGVELDDRSLVPGNNARIGQTRFADWLSWSRQESAARRSA